MSCFKSVIAIKGESRKGVLCHSLLIFTICLSSFQDVDALQETVGASSLISSATYHADSPISGLFEPIEISPAVIPQNPYPQESLPPMNPSVWNTYDPVLTGRCPMNFSAISSVINRTVSDCFAPFAPFLGNVICCPQVSSLLHIFLGHYNSNSNQLVLSKAVASDCFSDITSILASRGANSSICPVKALNLTGGSCPVKDVATFEKMVNTSKLLDSCSSVDPIKECCRPVCQAAIVEAAVLLSVGGSTVAASANVVGQPTEVDAISDCKGVVFSWLSKKLSLDAANTAFRILSACKVNKVCPLEFKEPSEVIKACRDLAAPNPSCCSSLNAYIAGIQNQMLITNRQAINCATQFGSMLQKGGVMTNIFELCDVDLKDFSFQGLGQQGCLLRSLPADVVFDNFTGVGFTCDLSDNIAAPWPSSSSMSSLTLCAPEMSLPALPTLQKSQNPGYRSSGFEFVAPIFSFFVFSILL